ncbi:MAG: hypothetical protein JSV05_09750 [Candidatus Bathyarchaeota archaeon]|nr:MAG: hypothetical protein JSV05_09750 [Candidatus Bathyarchaeota archaeon]
MADIRFIASLDVVSRLLADPIWRRRAKKIRTLKEMEQILLEFCKINGKILRIDNGFVYLY